MARPRQTFELKPDEKAALLAAEADFLSWRELRASIERPQDGTRIAAAGAAARKMVAALEELERTPELGALSARMQELDGMRSAQYAYRDMLDSAGEVLVLLDRACQAVAPDGRPVNHFVHEWIRCAARHWRNAGLPVRIQGRFARALQDGNGRIPAAGDRDVIAAALRVE